MPTHFNCPSRPRRELSLPLCRVHSVIRWSSYLKEFPAPLASPPVLPSSPAPPSFQGSSVSVRPGTQSRSLVQKSFSRFRKFSTTDQSPNGSLFSIAKSGTADLPAKSAKSVRPKMLCRVSTRPSASACVGRVFLRVREGGAGSLEFKIYPPKPQRDP